MGLVSLKSNLAINGTPQRYDTNGKLKDLPDGSSQLDFDSPLPSPVDNFTNNNANGFTIQAPIGVTQFVNNGQTSQLGFPGSTPPIYDFLTGIDPSKGQEKLTSYGFPGALPSGVDGIANTNANGFTIQTPVGVSQFVNKGQTSQLGFIAPLPSPVDFINNINANGFTIKAPVGVSDFISNGQTSQLGLIGTPQRYDIIGKLNDLPANASNLDIDGNSTGVDWIANTNAKGFTIKAPVGVSDFINNGQTSQLGWTGTTPPIYNFFSGPNPSEGQGVLTSYGFPGALPSFIANWFTNNNANGFTIQNPVGISQFVNDGQTSQLGLIGVPQRYDTSGKLDSLPDNASNLNIDGNPTGVDFIQNNNAKGFTIQNPIGVSQFVNKGQTSQLGFTSPLPAGVDGIANNNANGFTIQAPIGVTQFINDGQTSRYGFNSPLPSGVDFINNVNAIGFTIKAPIGVTQFINDGQTSQYGFNSPLPAPVDFINNVNAKGFTIQAPIGVTQFINDGQTSIYGFPGSLPAPVDFILNNNAGGFTIQAPIGVTQFINDGQTSIYGFPGTLPSPVDFINNNNSNGFTIQNPVGISQFINDGQTSIHGFPGSLPAPVDFILNNNAGGFTIQNPIGVTNFVGADVNNGVWNNTSLYGNVQTNSGIGVDWLTNNNANGFTIKNPVGVTQFVGADVANGVWNNTSLYGNIQNQPLIGVDFFLNNHAYGFTIKNPIGVSNYVNGGQTSIYGFWSTLPAPVNFLGDTNATGFTIKNPVGVTQFVGADTVNRTYINPTGKNLINSTLGDFGVNYLNDKPQRNFIIRQQRLASNFVGISQDYTTYNNPTGNRISTVDFFQDARSGATGFKPRLDPYESNFIGISTDNTKYQYPDSVYGARLLNVTLGPSGGTAKLENQLGGGSKMGNKGFYAENRYAEAVRNDSNQSLLASWALRRRSPSPLEQQYSKFKMRDEAFNPTYIAHPLILRGIQNPDVLNPQRWGIDALGQQEGRTAGNNLVAALDGGFIRGGASTALERAAIDTARIAKFLASPKGLVWSITQVGLGKSNIRPHGSMGYAEIAMATKNPIPLLNNTQTHLGLTSLLSVPGSAFGLHFTRHGVPFLNEVASYEYVLKSFTREEADKPGLLLNKLNRLKDELLDIKSPSDVSVGQPISNLSYSGGPQSVYGIGRTTVKRATDTLEGYKRYLYNQEPLTELKEVPPAPEELPIEDIGSVAAQAYAKQAEAIMKENNATAAKNEETKKLNEKNKKLDSEFTPKFNFKKRYALGLSNNKTGQGTIQADKQDAVALSAKNEDWWSNSTDASKLLGLSKKITEIGDKFVPGDTKLGDPTSPSVVQNAPKDLNTDINGNTHSVLPYAEIRRLAKERRNATNTVINDFRSNLTNSPDAQKSFSTDPKVSNYGENNLSKRYGFGDHGKRDADRSNPYKRKSNGQLVGNIDSVRDNLKSIGGAKSLSNDPEFRGDRINAIDFQSNVSEAEIYGNTKDFIKFYFSDIDMVDSAKDEVIVFRATIKGLADTFQPGWSNIQVMGRPDGPALYSSFERNIAFNFTVAATSREELVPMWRKLNYLASYTMPIYSGGGRPSGVLCRMTIGDMFKNTPGFFTGMTISVNDEATWDLADDIDIDSNKFSRVNKGAKQLPNLIDVDVQFRILHDWRPQKGGRVYHLYDGNLVDKSKLQESTSWLWDTTI
jgi:hypothetical protein